MLKLFHYRLSNKNKKFQIANNSCQNYSKETLKKENSFYRYSNSYSETLRHSSTDEAIRELRRCVIKKRDRDRRADGLIGEISNPPSLLFFPLVSIGRNASGRATPTAEHDYVLTCIPAIARSHARYPLRNTPLSAEIS